MRKQLIALAIFSSFSLNFVSMIKPTSVEAQSRNFYRCILKNGNPTTIVDTPRGRIDLIVWQNNVSMGFSSVGRCREISQRFQQFSDQGALRYITTGRINNQSVICVAQNRPGRGMSCRDDGLLITLQSTDNPSRVMEQLFDIGARVSGGSPLTRSTANNTSVLVFERFLNEVPLSDSLIDENMEIDSEENLERDALSTETSAPCEEVNPSQ